MNFIFDSNSVSYGEVAGPLLAWVWFTDLGVVYKRLGYLGAGGRERKREREKQCGILLRKGV